jgi:hypothetical protein
LISDHLPNNHSDKDSALYRSFMSSRSSLDCLAVIHEEEEEDGSLDEVEEEGWNSSGDSSDPVNDISSEKKKTRMIRELESSLDRGYWKVLRQSRR